MSDCLTCHVLKTELEVQFFNYLNFLATFLLETFTMPNLSYLDWRPQISGRFFCSNFLKLKEIYKQFFKCTILQTLLAIQKILQNSNIFNRSREIVPLMPFGEQNVTQFLGFTLNLASYLTREMLKICLKSPSKSG